MGESEFVFEIIDISNQTFNYIWCVAWNMDINHVV